MLNLLLPFLVIGFLFYRNYKNKRRLIIPSNIVISLYFVSLLFAYPYINRYNQLFILNGEYIKSSFVFCLLFLIFLLPFLSYREDTIKSITLPNKKSLYIIAIFCCIFSLFSIFYLFSSSIEALRNPDIGYARSQLSLHRETLLEENMLTLFATLFSYHYQIPMLLFFIFQILKLNRKIKWLLFLSSFSYVLYVFSNYGRDGVIFWFLSFLGIMGIFYPYLDKKFKKSMGILLIIFVVIGGGFFLLISFSRFEDTAVDSLISYIGQGIPNFMIAYKIDAPISHGASFPFFRFLFGLENTVDTQVQTYYLEQKGSYSYVFGTFLKTFLLNFGFLGSMLIGIFFYLLFKWIVNQDRGISLASLVIYILYFQILYQGVFYFLQYGMVGNLLIVFSFLIYFLIKQIIKYGKNNIIINLNENNNKFILSK